MVRMNLRPLLWVGLSLCVVSAAAGCKPKDGAAKGDAAASMDMKNGTAPVSAAGLLNGGFEGDISFKVESKGKDGAAAAKDAPKDPKAKALAPPMGKKDEPKNFTVDLHVKGDKVRIDVPQELAKDMAQATGGGPAYGLIHTGEKKAWFVMETPKKGILFDLDKQADELRGMAKGRSTAAPGGKPDPAKIPKITRTGKKSKIAGFDCEDWEFKDPEKNDKALVCIAETDTSWLKLPTKLLPDNLGALAELMDGKHMPVRAIMMTNDIETARVEATKIEKKTIPEASVNVPADIQVTDLMTFIQAMMGAGAPGGPPGMPPGMPPGRPGAMKPPTH